MASFGLAFLTDLCFSITCFWLFFATPVFLEDRWHQQHPKHASMHLWHGNASHVENGFGRNDRIVTDARSQNLQNIRKSGISKIPRKVLRTILRTMEIRIMLKQKLHGLKLNKKKLQKDLKSAKGDGAVLPDDDENVFSEKSSIATTTELEKDVQDLEDDFKLYQARLKLSPDCPRRQGVVECTKQQLEAKRKLLHDSRDPEDQIRNKAQRLKRIKAETETYRKQLREACLEEEAAEKRANELRAKILRHLEESEKLRSESRSL